MFRSNHMVEVDKITLVGWVDQALEQSFTKKKLGLGLKLHELMLNHACKARHGIEATMTFNDDP